MRSLITLFFTCLMLGSFAQSYSSSQKTLITKRTATWCPNCGAWGWDMAKGIDALERNDAILIRAHHSGELQSQVAKDITDNFDAVYQPEFYINEIKQAVGSTTWTSKIAEFAAIIDENSAKQADFSFALTSSFQDDVVTSDVKVNFLNSVEGDFYLATYLLEDSVVANQASQGSASVHNSVLRMSLSGESFGDQFLDGAADAGSSASVSSSVTIEGGNVADRKFKVLAVVWKKENDKYKIANLHSTTVNQFSSINSTLGLPGYLRFQVGTDLNVSFELKENLNNGRIIIHGVEGRQLTSETFNPIIGENEIVLSVNNWSGQFVVLSIIGDNVLLHSEKILIE